MSKAYLNYAAKRLVQAIVVILLAYVFTFVVVSILPGDPISNVLNNPQNGFTQEEIKEIIAAQGLDKPIPVQLWTSFSGFVTGDLGLSMRTNRPVTTLIAEVLPSTLVLASAGLAVALLLAAVIAYGTQFLPKRLGQGLLRGFPSLFLSVPNFVIGLVLIHLFGFQLGVFRVIEPDSVWATLFAAIALGIPISAQIAEVLIANLDHEFRAGIRRRCTGPRPRANAVVRQAPAQAIVTPGRHCRCADDRRAAWGLADHRDGLWAHRSWQLGAKVREHAGPARPSGCRLAGSSGLCDCQPDRRPRLPAARPARQESSALPSAAQPRLTKAPSAFPRR